MFTIKKTILALSVLSFSVHAEPLTFTFKSPSFTGNGYSAHVLTLENQEHSRREAIRDRIQSELDKAERVEAWESAHRKTIGWLFEKEIIKIG